MQLEEIAKAGRFRLSACAGRYGATVSPFYERAVGASASTRLLLPRAG